MTAAWPADRGTHPESPLPIAAVARQLGLAEGDFEPLGWHKAKFAPDFAARIAARPTGKYVLVTATSPTPLGEGKTVTAIGLALGLTRLCRSALCALREPSLGPLFGVKGGGAGGGRATLWPQDDINLHFTGDFHAVTAAANLLAALADNHALRRADPQLDPQSISWPRALDVCDRSLRHITTQTTLGSASLRRDGEFRLTPASEVMAILALSSSLSDLRQRLGRIVVGHRPDGQFVTAEDLQAAGAMAALLKDAIRPNLVQTCGQTPALVHAGPFANIAHGNSSILADQIGTRLAEYVVTESGFGADCGAEKFFHIKSAASGLSPHCVVLVTTVRALKLHSGRWSLRPGQPLPADLLAPNISALRAGAVNLQAHLDLLRQFGPPIVVAINRFPTDGDDELREIERIARLEGAADTAVSEAFVAGGAGGESLARAVERICARPASFQPLYSLDLPPDQKIRTIATRIYGAADVDFAPSAIAQLERLNRCESRHLPICIAKTPYSLSHDPRRLGRPTGFRLPIREIHLAAGAGFLFALAGDISTMPGLPARPAACDVDVAPDGRILGLK